ncbi:MAG: PKD domain-containing protein, partial [Bacteroidota bacterium]
MLMPYSPNAMKKFYLSFIFLLGFAISAFAQGPNVRVKADTTVHGPGDTIHVPVKVYEFWNIVICRGNVSWDTSVVEFIDIPYYGVPFMTPATFNTAQAGSGILSWNWQHLISIGSTLTDGDSLFSIRYRVVGNIGDASPIGFPNAPIPTYWFNFAAWTGPLDTLPGRVIVGCFNPSAAFSDSANNQTINFTNQTAGGTSYLWDFGDGNTDTVPNPQHTYATTGTYTVCLIATNSCGADTTCSTLNVTCNSPGTAFSESSNLLLSTFTDQSANTPTSWLWDFGDGNTSTQQNPT